MQNCTKRLFENLMHECIKGGFFKVKQEIANIIITNICIKIFYVSFKLF